MSGIEMEGFDELRDELEELQRRAEKLGEKEQVSFEEFFSPRFMRRHTEFDSIDAMLDASEWKIESLEDFRAIPDESWDEFVANNTRFETWEQMFGAAEEQYVKRQLDLD